MERGPWVSVFLHLFLLLSIFSESSEMIGLKFGHSARIDPGGDHREFNRDSFCIF
jgi:hypothetical protein